MTGEGAGDGGDARALGVGLAAHLGGQGGRHGPALVAVVGETQRHENGPEIGVAQPERPVVVAVAGDRPRRIAGVVDDELLGGDHHVDGVCKA